MPSEDADDFPAIGKGSIVAQLRRNRQPGEVQFSIKPTWGTSRLRDVVTTSNGGTVTETGGEVQVSTSTNANGAATLTTVERGQYRPGFWGVPSVAVRIPTADTLSGSQDERWGYFDGDNGFGWGVDSDGLYTFRQTGGTETKNRPTDWNGFGLDASDLINGLVCHIAFKWYGHGPVRWFAVPKFSRENYADYQLVDDRVYLKEVSVVDPNQPIEVKVDNGGTSGSDLSVFVGGRQFSLWGEGQTSFEQRPTSVFERAYTVNTTDTWESVIALRKSPTLGPSGRTNSVRAVMRSFDAIADKLSEMRISMDASVSSVTWTTPEGVSADETAIQRDDGTGFTVDDQGRPGTATLVDNDGGSIRPDNEIPFSDTNVALLQVRSATSSATFDSILGKLLEQW